MSHRRLYVLSMVFAILLSAEAIFANVLPPMTANLEWKGRIVVEFREDLGSIQAYDESGIALLHENSLDALSRQFKIFHLEKLIPWSEKPAKASIRDLSRYYILSFSPDIDLHEVVKAYAANPHIISAEPYLIRRLDYVPSDPFYLSQWAMSQVGAAEAYDYARGSTEIVAGIVDSGTDTAHVDLRDNLWVNPGEDLDGNGIIDLMEWNNIDDDLNGFVDDFWGWNVWQGNFNIQDPPSAGHGTQCAGDVTAVTDNSTGVASLGCKAKIMTARAGDGEFIMAGVQGIIYCVDNGAKVISLSYGGPGYSSYEQSVITNAWNNGVIVFASAGNEGNTAPRYPASYENVISVAATGQGDVAAYFTSYGTTVDCCAPGVEIMSTLPGGGYAAWSGTSFSCPLTAGLACLVWSAMPDWTNAEVAQQILTTCVNIDALNNPIYWGLLGRGRIDAGAALSTLFPNLAFTENELDDSAGNGNGRPDPGETVNVLVSVVNNSAAVSGTNVAVTLTCDDPDISIVQGVNNFGEIPPGMEQNNHSDPLSFSVNPNAQAHEVTFVLTLSETTLLYPPILEFTEMVGRPDIVIIDDDGGMAYQQWYSNDLDSLGIVHDIWNIQTNGVISQEELALYSKAIWHTSTTDDPLSEDEQGLIQTYLLNGGHLFLTGEDIDEQLAGTPFYADVLHSASASSAGGPQLTGIAGDPISAGTTLFLAGAGGAANNQSPSSIAAQGSSTLMYTYNNNSLGAALSWSDGQAKLVYCAFNFEAASGIMSTSRMVVLNNILHWLDGTPAVEPGFGDNLPTAFALRQNYPNPFNPSTEIIFALQHASSVRLAVYDLSGKLITTLIKGDLPAGQHSIKFQAEDLSSGIYLYRLEAGSTMLTQKMILLK